MICKPNSDFPLLDFQSIRKLQHSTKILENKQLSGDHLKDVLSLYSNEYLACRWNLFLDNVPENYITIRLYLENKSFLKNRTLRRKLLNGKFYDFDNKSAPIP